MNINLTCSRRASHILVCVGVLGLQLPLFRVTVFSHQLQNHQTVRGDFLDSSFGFSLTEQGETPVFKPEGVDCFPRALAHQFH